MRGDSMQVPDQVSVRWHIGMQPEEPSLYLISVFAFLPAVYITLCFFFSRPLIRLRWGGGRVFSFLLWPEKM